MKLKFTRTGKKKDAKTVLDTSKVALESTAKGLKDYRPGYKFHNGEIVGYHAGAINGMQESLNDAPVMAESPADRILKGIEFRTKGGRSVVVDRIQAELSDAVHREFMSNERRSDQREKSLHNRIEKLEEALRLEQHRHFVDIQTFAGGGNSVMAAERSY